MEETSEALTAGQEYEGTPPAGSGADVPADTPAAPEAGGEGQTVSGSALGLDILLPDGWTGSENFPVTEDDPLGMGPDPAAGNTEETAEETPDASPENGGRDAPETEAGKPEGTPEPAEQTEDGAGKAEPDYKALYEDLLRRQTDWRTPPLTPLRRT